MKHSQGPPHGIESLEMGFIRVLDDVKQAAVRFLEELHRLHNFIT